MEEVNLWQQSSLQKKRFSECYLFMKKIKEDDLSKYNLLESYHTLCKEFSKEIEEFQIDDNEIIRYIYGWKGDVINVKRVLVELHQWRLSYKPELITIDEFSFEKVNYDQIGRAHV